MNQAQHPISPKTVLRCARCRGDLTGSAVGGRCLHCGKPVAQSLTQDTWGPEPGTRSGLDHAVFLFGNLAMACVLIPGGGIIMGLLTCMIVAEMMRDARRGIWSDSYVWAGIGIAMAMAALVLNVFATLAMMLA